MDWSKYTFDLFGDGIKFESHLIAQHHKDAACGINPNGIGFHVIINNTPSKHLYDKNIRRHPRIVFATSLKTVDKTNIVSLCFMNYTGSLPNAEILKTYTNLKCLTIAFTNEPSHIKLEDLYLFLAQNLSLEMLRFSNVIIDEIDLIPVLSSLKSNTTIQALELVNVRVGKLYTGNTSKTFRAIASILKTNQFLSYLCLDMCDDMSSVDFENVCCALQRNTSLECLILALNGLDVGPVLEFIYTNRYLRTLMLSSDKSCRSVFEALKFNASIQRCVFEFGPEDEELYQLMAETVEMNGTLVDIYEPKEMTTRRSLVPFLEFNRRNLMKSYGNF